MVSFFFLYYNLFLFLYLYLYKYYNYIYYIFNNILRVREKIYIGYHIGYHIGYNFYTQKCYICACARKFKFVHVRLHQLSCTRIKCLFRQFQNQDKG